MHVARRGQIARNHFGTRDVAFTMHMNAPQVSVKD